VSEPPVPGQLGAGSRRGGPPSGDASLTAHLERLIFGHRSLILVVFSLITAILLVVTARGLRIDASFTKQLPAEHEYMRTYLSSDVAEFRGANRLLIALLARDGNMFSAGLLCCPEGGHGRGRRDGGY